MTNQNNRPKDAAALRQKAEALALEQAARTPEDSATLSPEEMRKTLHELRVHQIELEMQNEELRTAQAVIEAGRARYFDLYDLAPAGYCTLSEQGLILEANLAAATLLGMARGDLIGQPISRFILKEDQDLYYLHRKNLFETGEPQGCELRLVKLDGAFFWAHLTGTSAQAEDGSPVCRCLISDITARKRTEEEMHNAHHRLSYALKLTTTIISAVPIPLFYKDREGRYIGVNDAFSELMGFTPDYYAGKTVMELWPSEFAEMYHRKDLELMRHPEKQVYDFKVLDKHGAVHQAIWSKNVFRDENGEVAGIVGAFQDITERKRAENELRKSESLFRTLVNTIPDLIWLKDADGVYLSCNKRFERFFGAGEADIVGKTDHDFVDEDLADFFRENDRKALAAGGPTSNEEQITFADDGRQAFLETIKSPMFDADGKLIGILGIGRDITERKQVERELKSREDLLNRIIDESPFATWISDAEGTLQRANPALKRMLNLTDEQLVGQYNVLEDPNVERQGLMESVRSVFEQGRTIHFNLEWSGEDVPDLDLKGSKRVHIEATMFPIQGPGGELTNVVLHWIDITERKRAENELRKSESLFRTLVNTIPDLIWLKDADGVYLSCNKRFERFFGAGEADIVGKTDHDFVDEDLADFFRENDRKALAAGGPTSNEEQITFADDGHQAFLETIKSPMFDADGKLIGILGIGRDITERKRMEEALRESVQRLGFALQGGKLGTWDWNPQNGAVVYSDLWAQMLEYRPDEVEPTVEFFKQHVHSEDLAAVLDRLTGHIEGRLPEYESEYRLRTKSGRFLWVMDRGRIVERDKDGGPLRVTGIIADITERKQLEMERQKFFLLAESSSEFIGMCDLDMNPFYVNPAGRAMVGLPDMAAACRVKVRDYYFPEDQRFIVEEFFPRVLREGHGEVEIRLRHFQTGEPIWMWMFYYPLIVNDAGGAPVGWATVSRNITERKQAEEALIRQQRSIKLTNRIATVFLTSSRNEVFADVLDVLLKALDSRFGYFGYIDEAGDLVCPSMTRDVWDQCQVAEKSVVFPRAVWAGLWGRSLMEKRTLIANENLRIPEGHVALENALATPIVYNDKLIGQFVVADKAGGYDNEDRDLLESAAAQTAPILFAIQEEARQKTAKEKLEEQLRQAQKMESVGRLAGGVAHDFNNMLGIIIGHADMLLEDMDPDHAFHAGLTEIRKAGARSADLTRQLLAFARKQTVAPKVLDLNKAVEGMLKMLQRLIGEEIDMAWIPGDKVWPVKIDPGQIDQILANLCVNARDAIAGVGKVTIETGDAVFDEAYCKAHAGFTPGEYAMLAVSDNGCGMDSETMSHLFEPFFTTKKLGKGTGLGLATVYGVVKQNNGFINVYSEPGQGTTLRIYLPRHRAKEAPMRDKEANRPAARGHETILLVEDEPAILKMTTMMLKREGYTALAAGTPGEAIRLATEHAGHIHLLMTDVVMPEMNGRDLAKNILSLYPRLKCLFMSGYTANVIAHRGILDEGVNFIQKPFSLGDLAAKVREALES